MLIQLKINKSLNKKILVMNTFYINLKMITQIKFR